MKNAVLVLLLISMLAACYYRNEETLYPDMIASCDTTNLTFSGGVLPILQANCFRCHSALENATSGGNLNFEDFNVFKDLAVSGTLMGALTHDPKLVPMPKGGSKLDTCSILKVKVWIDKGTPHN